MGFPQLSNIAKEFVDTINSKAGNNVKASGIMPWIRVTSTLGDYLSLESSTNTQTFAQKYGNTERSGRLGVNKNNTSVFAESDTERAYRPSPTISDITISQGNEGLSKKTSFIIVAYSLGQAELLMEHFLEPGNMVLVEWGENNANSVSQKSELDKCSIAAYNNLAYVQKKRAISKGTYDAVLGNITGGDVKFGSNESYEISVELTSIGELPAYLQHHKNISSDTGDTTESGKTFEKSEIKQQASRNEGIGKALFMQMFNDLPQEKRITSVKNLGEQSWATNEANFINIDKEISEDLVRGVENAKIVIGGEKFKIPSDTPIFSNKRFIRCALAFHILDLQSNVSLIPVKTDCNDTNSSSATINWLNTICRAHRHMFSADSNFLYIPNKQSPSFDLAGVLKSETALSNPIPDFASLDTDSVDIHPDGEKKYSYFPNENPLNFPDQGLYDNQYPKIETEGGKWGYLRDLYINFDFFCECIQSTALVTKEVWYKILNGMSSAVNLYWDFQIVPRGTILEFKEGSNKDDEAYKYLYSLKTPIPGDEELQIVDVSFIGKKQTGLGRAKFQSRGAKTPFLEASLNIDIPSAMKGQIIGNKLSSKSLAAKNPNKEQKEQNLEGLFTSKTDEVLDVLNSIRNQTDVDITDSTITPDTDGIKEQKIANFEMFIGNACIVPKTQDRSKARDFTSNFSSFFFGDFVDLSTIMVVGAFNDSNLLKVVQRFDDGYLTNEPVNKENQQDDLPLLPIKFDFTIHGVSGLRVGDTFNIIDLPLFYKNFIFQIKQVEHKISQNIWTTQVTGELRMIPVSTDNPNEFASNG